MAASNDTARQLIEVLTEYLPDPERRRALASALYARVRGNASVLETLKRLYLQTATDCLDMK